MRKKKGSGIVLSFRLFGESDALCDILSTEEGLITVLAKGIRTTKSRRKGIVVPFSELSYERLLPSQNRLSILTTTLRVSSPPISHPTLLALLSTMSEVSSALLPKAKNIPHVFTLWHKLLASDVCRHIKSHKVRHEYLEYSFFHLGIWFFLHFFQSLGIFPFIPEFHSSVRTVIWTPCTGFVLQSSTITPRSIPLSIETLRFFSWYLASPVEKIYNTCPHARIIEETYAFFDIFLSSHLTWSLKSWKILEYFLPKNLIQTKE